MYEVLFYMDAIILFSCHSDHDFFFCSTLLNDCEIIENIFWPQVIVNNQAYTVVAYTCIYY